MVVVLQILVLAAVSEEGVYGSGLGCCFFSGAVSLSGDAEGEWERGREIEGGSWTGGSSQQCIDMTCMYSTIAFLFFFCFHSSFCFLIHLSERCTPCRAVSSFWDSFWDPIILWVVHADLPPCDP